MNTDNQQLREEYEIKFINQVQYLASKRAELFTQ